MSRFEPITENPDIINRESFTGTTEEKEQLQHNGSIGIGGVFKDINLAGDAESPASNEAGWKDTAVMLPGKVTRLITRFDRSGRYDCHCHILALI
jgi:FtsP/CotA-like multicopper oxidase with cupredoxin domain